MIINSLLTEIGTELPRQTMDPTPNSRYFSTLASATCLYTVQCKGYRHAGVNLDLSLGRKIRVLTKLVMEHTHVIATTINVITGHFGIYLRMLFFILSSHQLLVNTYSTCPVMMIVNCSFLCQTVQLTLNCWNYIVCQLPIGSGISTS